MKKGRKMRPYPRFGGDKGIRTPDLCVANASLYQLSHIPSLVYAIISNAFDFVKYFIAFEPRALTVPFVFANRSPLFGCIAQMPCKIIFENDFENFQNSFAFCSNL